MSEGMMCLACMGKNTKVLDDPNVMYYCFDCGKSYTTEDYAIIMVAIVTGIMAATLEQKNDVAVSLETLSLCIENLAAATMYLATGKSDLLKEQIRYMHVHGLLNQFDSKS